MDTTPPHDQFREIARINQQPIYFPNALGMERLKWVWGILAGIICFIFLATWQLSNRSRDLSDAKADIAALKVDVATNKLVIGTYDWKLWWDQHRTMWDMRARGESNKEAFFREHGRPAPGQPER